MNNKLLIGPAPVTQCREAVVELLKYLGKPSDPLPSVVPLADGAQLIQSSKGDCFYYTSSTGCSCPGFFYRHSCKHTKALAGSSSRPRSQTIAETLEEHDRNLHRVPKSYQGMVKLSREQAEAEEDPDSLIKRNGFKPIYPGDEEV